MNFYSLLFRVWRPRRVRRMRAALGVTREMSFLDVGGMPYFWSHVPPFVTRVDLVNPDCPTEGERHAHGHNFKCLRGDGCHLPFGDRAYDVVFSNSVIEHVGDRERRREFAGEIRRVAKSYWVQTPAAEFPVEPHYLGVGIHWLPRRRQLAAARWLSVRGLLRRLDHQSLEEIHRTTELLSRAEFTALFPDGQILVERFCGWPKSYIAYRCV